uniref:Rabaptin coiled-coil domain-containing protein n=1 Tax=Ursus maritimus TaxID=29073 RepID=A0A452TNM8_URSMA
MKAVAEVSESTKAEAVAAVQRQCQEEVASLQAILKESISSYEAQITSLKQERQQQQQDCEEKERELGRLKRLLSRAHPLDSLEKQMEKVGVTGKMSRRPGWPWGRGSVGVPSPDHWEQCTQ